MKRLMKLLSYSLLAVTSIVGLNKLQHSNNDVLKLSANEQVEKYIPVNNDNFSVTNNTKADVQEWVTGRYGTFWNHRYFNALDDFYDGFRDEFWTGRLISKSWVQTKDYVTFTLGGNPFDGEHIKNYVEIKSGEDVIATVHNSDFHDPGLSLNMIVKVVEIPIEYKGETLHLEVVDGKTGGFGGVTFGALKVNQTSTEVTRTIATHKVSLARHDTVAEDVGPDHGERNTIGRAETLRLYGTNAEYANFLAPLTNVDEDFEQNALTNWGYDIEYSKTDVENDDYYFLNFTAGVTNISTFWDHKEVPYNKQGEYFFLGVSAAPHEPAKYRLLSAPFVVSGSGYFSVKMGGRTAELQVLDAGDLTILESFRNPTFNDRGVDAIISSGSRLSTMTRVHLDATEFLGQEVIIALADAENGGDWGLAVFDELITNQPTPSFKLDLLSHDGENGVNFDHYIGSEESALGKAYSFVSNYYTTLRGAGTDYSYCSLFDTDIALLHDFVLNYEDLENEVKAIVSSSDDYSYGLDAEHDGNYLLNNVELTTIGTTMAYLGVVLPQNYNVDGLQGNAIGDPLSLTITVGAIGLTLLSLYFFVLKKKKEN